MFTAFESLFIFSAKQKRNADWRPVLLWRRERDSNPRVLAHKLISSQPRYDHFDISPHMIKLKTSLIFKIHLAGRPVMSCCGTRNFLLAYASQNFDRCHFFLLALSATGSARKRPHFDISPYLILLNTEFDIEVLGQFIVRIHCAVHWRKPIYLSVFNFIEYGV